MDREQVANGYIIRGAMRREVIARAKELVNSKPGVSKDDLIDDLFLTIKAYQDARGMAVKREMVAKAEGVLL